MAKTIQVDNKTFIRFWLVIAALVIIAILLIKAKVGLIIVGIAMFLAIAFTPLMKKINNKIKRKKSHLGLSAGLVVGGLVLIFAAVIAFVGPVIIQETSEFVANAPEQIQSTLSKFTYINAIGEKFGIDNAQVQIVTFSKDALQKTLGSVPEALFTSVSTIASFFTAAILTIVLTILFMTQGPDLLSSILRRFDEKHGKATKLAQDILKKIANVVSSYVTGQFFVAIIDGIVTGLAVLLLSLIFGFSANLAIPMGLLAIIFYMIPMFGPVITCIIVSLLLFFSNPWAALAFLIFYALFEQVQGNIIAPRIQGNHMALPPLVILVSITLGMYMFGLLGAIVSIPVAGIIKVLIDEYPRMRELAQDN